MEFALVLDEKRLDADIAAFKKAAARFSTELGNSARVAARRAIIYFVKSLRARTLRAPKKARLREVEAHPYAGAKPHYITDKGGKLAMHRWTLVRRKGTGHERTRDYYVNAHLRRNKAGRIMGDLTAEKRELLEVHARIKNWGLARKSWGWFMQSLFNRANPEEGKNRKLPRITPQMATAEQTAVSSGRDRLYCITIHNKLGYIREATPPGVLAEALRAATKNMDGALDKGMAKARKELE